MGPSALFDKSFLQSLSVDEAVWFDHFMLPVICPIFIVETLGDLYKEGKNRKGIDDLKYLAHKAPEKDGHPTIAHWKLINSELKGQRLTLDFRPHLEGGRPTLLNGRKGLTFDHIEEFKTFERWKNEEFEEVEKTLAKSWRNYLENGSISIEDNFLNSISPPKQQIKTIKDVAEHSKGMLLSISNEYSLFDYIFSNFNIPQTERQYIYALYQQSKPTPFHLQFPYLHHILTVECFFFLGVRASLIAAERLTNHVDFTYYYYLPFATTFISCDKLHKRTASELMSSEQLFIDGHELKSELKKLNEHYMELPSEIKEKGLYSFASRLPSDWEGLLADIWDRFIPNWRHPRELNLTPEQTQKMLTRMKQQEVATNDEMRVPCEDDLEQVSIKKMVKKKKGNWYQIAKDYE